MLNHSAQVFIHGVVNSGFVAIFRFLRSFFLFLLFRGKRDSVSPPGIFVHGDGLVVATFFNCLGRPGKSSGFRGFAARHDLVFQLAQGAEQLAGFKRFDDEGVGADALGFFRLERLQFAHGQQDWNPRRFPCFLEALAHLKPAVAGHINVQHDQVGFMLGDLFQRRGAVVHGDYFVSRIREDLPPHVLSGYAVIGEQYLPSQVVL